MLCLSTLQVSTTLTELTQKSLIPLHFIWRNRTWLISILLRVGLPVFRYEAGVTLSGLIYFHRISDFRMGGISRRNFSMFRKLCGDSTLKNVVIVTNMWSEVGESKGEMREAELRKNFFKPALDKGAQLLRHNNSVKSAHNILRYIIQNRPLPLEIQEELVDQGKTIDQTNAAKELESQIQELIKKHQKEIKEMQKEMRGSERPVYPTTFLITKLYFQRRSRRRT